VSDRRYGSLRWKKLRLLVLARDNYECQVRGPRCRGAASTVHHIIPSSQAPELFFDAGNLQASCGACNFSAGAYMTRDARRALVEQNEYLERVVEVQEQRIAELENQLARSLDRNRRTPAIH
jgi:5-methylcytosine-specific restriction endonuclease McrA